MVSSLYEYLLIWSLLRHELTSSAFTPNYIRPNKSTSNRQPKSIGLLMARNNDRARVEKKFEDMMDNDWREFRAKLVAREKAEELAIEAAKTKTMTGNSAVPPKEEKFSELLSGAFTSIFKGGKDDSNDMFKGNVGGANSKTKFASVDFPSECEDPFLSLEECHLMYNEPANVEINKHRWAHPLGYIEPGCVLVANEKLGGVFHQTVVLIIDHHEKIGSTGMIINRLVCVCDLNLGGMVLFSMFITISVSHLIISVGHSLGICSKRLTKRRTATLIQILKCHFAKHQFLTVVQ